MSYLKGGPGSRYSWSPSLLKWRGYHEAFVEPASSEADKVEIYII